MSVYLDASVILPLFVQDSFSTKSEDAIVPSLQRLIVSDWAALEVANVIMKRERMGDIEAGAGGKLLADFDKWRANMAHHADVQASDVKFATSLVRRTDLVLRGPDAVHIAIATRLNASLLTFDNAMSSAARALGLALTD